MTYVRGTAAILTLLLLITFGLVSLTLETRDVHGLCTTEDSVSCVWINDGHVVINGPEQR